MLTTIKGGQVVVLLSTDDPIAEYMWPLVTNGPETTVYTVGLPWWYWLRTRRAVRRRISEGTGFIFEQDERKP